MNGKELREARTQANLTQKQLGQLIGKTESFICFLEKDRRLAGKKIVKKLEFIFRNKGVSLGVSFEDQVLQKLDRIIELLNPTPHK